MKRSSMDTVLRTLSAVLLDLLFATMAIGHLLAQEVPLPVVQRTRPPEGYVFDRPSLVVIARITAQVKREMDTDDPLEQLTLKNVGFWTYVNAEVFQVLRVNERLPGDPDLAQGHFMLEQLDRRERPLPLELGRYYVLFLRPSPEFLPNWRPSDNQLCCPPPYALAVPQGGFELMDLRVLPFVSGLRDMIDATLRPISKGGPLDSYEGRRLSDVLKEMRGHG
jgi:hypothetical protein